MEACKLSNVPPKGKGFLSTKVCAMVDDVYTTGITETVDADGVKTYTDKDGAPITSPIEVTDCAQKVEVINPSGGSGTTPIDYERVQTQACLDGVPVEGIYTFQDGDSAPISESWKDPVTGVWGALPAGAIVGACEAKSADLVVCEGEGFTEQSIVATPDFISNTPDLGGDWAIVGQTFVNPPGGTSEKLISRIPSSLLGANDLAGAVLIFDLAFAPTAPDNGLFIYSGNTNLSTSPGGIGGTDGVQYGPFTTSGTHTVPLTVGYDGASAFYAVDWNALFEAGVSTTVSNMRIVKQVANPDELSTSVHLDSCTLKSLTDATYNVNVQAITDAQAICETTNTTTEILNHGINWGSLWASIPATVEDQSILEASNTTGNPAAKVVYSFDLALLPLPLFIRIPMAGGSVNVSTGYYSTLQQSYLPDGVTDDTTPFTEAQGVYSEEFTITVLDNPSGLQYYCIAVQQNTPTVRLRAAETDINTVTQQKVNIVQNSKCQEVKENERTQSINESILNVANKLDLVTGVCALPPAENLIIDGTFDDVGGGGNILFNWNEVTDNGKNVTVIGGVATFPAPALGSAQISQEVPTTAGKEYTLKFDKSISTAGAVYIGGVFYPSVLGANNIPYTATSSLTEVKFAQGYFDLSFGIDNIDFRELVDTTPHSYIRSQSTDCEKNFLSDLVSTVTGAIEKQTDSFIAGGYVVYPNSITIPDYVKDFSISNTSASAFVALTGSLNLQIPAGGSFGGGVQQDINNLTNQAINVTPDIGGSALVQWRI